MELELNHMLAGDDSVTDKSALHSDTPAPLGHVAIKARQQFHPTNEQTEDTQSHQSHGGTKVAIKLLEILHKHASNGLGSGGGTRTGPQPPRLASVHHDKDEIDKWLDEILALASDPDILSAALEIYVTDKEPNKSMSRKPFHQSKNFIKSHFKKHGGPPTFHVKGRHSVMTFKRTNNESSLASTRNQSDTSIVGAPLNLNQSDDGTTPAVRWEYDDYETEDIGSLSLEGQLEDSIETKILKYIINNITIKAEEAKIITASGNETFIDRIANAKMPFNWLIIAICVTFTVTCLCSLGAGLVIMTMNRRKFNADTWWNGKDVYDGDERTWLVSKSDEDLELGESSSLKTLYSLQGEELKKQLSKVVHDVGESSNASTSSDLVR